MSNRALWPVTDARREALEEATTRYEEALTPDAGAWLAAGGIRPETARVARLGVAVDPLPEHGKFRGYLAIPFLDADGAPLQLRFRRLNGRKRGNQAHGKYHSIAGEPTRMFNIEALHDPFHEIHVCEDLLDALVLKQAGLLAVAIPDADYLPRHRRMLAGFGRVWCWGDPKDGEAGLTSKVVGSLPQARAVDVRASEAQNRSGHVFDLKN